MLDNRRLLTLAIIISLVGVVSLFYYASTIEPKYMSISEIGEGQVGSMVKLNGTIQSFKVLDDGSASFKVVDTSDNASIVVYVRDDVYDVWNSRSLAVPGAKIEAVGIIEIYDGIFELVVNSIEELNLLAPAGDDIIPIWQLLDSKDVFEGMTVRTNGTMKNPYFFDGGMGFELMEKHGNRSYYLGCVLLSDEVLGDYDINDKLEVIGTFQYYAPSGSWQLTIEAEGDIKLTP